MPRIHILNVPETVTVEQLRLLCQSLGLEGAIHYARDPVAGCYLGKAYLRCQTAEEARDAVSKLHDYPLAGVRLQVEVSRTEEFFDEDGLFADGSASMGRRDGEPSSNE